MRLRRAGSSRIVSPQSKVTHFPDWRAQHRSNGKVRASFVMHIFLLMRPTYADGNYMDVNRFKKKVSAEPAMSAY